jgi:hypothetical protein
MKNIKLNKFTSSTKDNIAKEAGNKPHLFIMDNSMKEE